MTGIIFDKVDVEYPLYSMENFSLRHRVFNKFTGGVLSKSASSINVVQALSAIDITVSAGERVFLLGHNGSGKSTLLRVIAGVYPPVRGKLAIEGDVSSLIDPSLGMDYEASGIENIYLKGYLLGKSKREINRIVDDVVDFSGLGDFIHLPVRTYSSGMVMRLAFSISTSITPQILLLDEWLSVGDSDFKEKASKRLQGFVDQVEILILATHDEKLAADVATRIIRLEHGKIIEDTRV